MNPYFPIKSNTYIPTSSTDIDKDLTVEEIKSGQVVAVSEDGTKGTACVKKGSIISFIAVFLNEDGSIKGVIPRPASKYVRMTPVKSEETNKDQAAKLKEALGKWPTDPSEWEKEDGIIKED